MIFPRKKDLVYQLALQSTNAITGLFRLIREGEVDLNIDENSFVKMFPNDPKSPAIYWMAKDQYFIRYPANSKPYSHKFHDKCKFIECLSGKLFVENSKRETIQRGQNKGSPNR